MVVAEFNPHREGVQFLSDELSEVSDDLN